MTVHLSDQPPRIGTALDPTDPRHRANRAQALAELAAVHTGHQAALAGGGQASRDRHHGRGRLLPRQRLELLLDPDSPFLELSPLAGWGSQYTVGASVVTGIGLVESTPCLLIAQDPTVRGGAANPWTVRKILRALQIAGHHRLPVVLLTESAGADLRAQSEVFVPGGRIYRELTRLSAAGVPTLALVLGTCTAGGAYLAGMSDYVVMVRDQARVFLGGPPLVKMATGADSDEETLGGATMHAHHSGLADHLADSEADALRLGRRIIARLPPRHHPGPPNPSQPPHWDSTELLDLIPADPRQDLDARQVIARLVDGSRFDEFKPCYGPGLVTGQADLHGWPIGILANNHGVLFGPEARKAAQFVQLANQTGTPLLFLQNTTGYIIGAEYERDGIIKYGAMMINAVANSHVPHLTVVIGSSYGAGNYGMSGRAYDPRFLFNWPNARTAVMGPQQLAGVLQQVSSHRDDLATITDRVSQESNALHLSGQLYDDGVIDPRDTRTVLGICLAVVHNTGPTQPPPAPTQPGYGVFRL